MAACIVCNGQAAPDVSSVGMCARLEKVLNETVPKDSVLCASCHSDLEQIETYYILLTVFKKRYADTAKLRLQSLSADTSRNLIQEKMDADTGLLLQSTVTDDLTSPETSSQAVQFKIHNVRTIKNGSQEVGAGLVSQIPVQSVSPGDISEDCKKEPTVDMSSTPGRPLSASVESVINETFSDSSVEAATWESDEDDSVAKTEKSEVSEATQSGSSQYIKVTKRRGRLRRDQLSNVNLSPKVVLKKIESTQLEQNTVVQSVPVATITISRMHGRPKKSEQAMGLLLDVSAKTVKKRGRPRKDASQSSTVFGKKVGRPRKNKQSSGSKHRDVKEEPVVQQETSTNFDDSPSEGQLFGGQYSDDTDLDDLSYDPKPSSSQTFSSKQDMKNDANRPSANSDPTTSQDPLVDGDGEPMTKKRRGRPKKSQDKSNMRAVAKKKQTSPKQLEEGSEQALTCTVCNKVFNVLWKLKKHFQRHSEDRPCVCPICNRTFKTMSDLGGHKRIHTDMADRPFKCDICGKAFLWEKLLKGHMRVHSDARPFECDQCDRRFKTRPNLKFHIKTNHGGGKKYLCNLCGASLTTESSLRNHMKTHSEARPYKCGTCGRGFSAKDYLVKHELTHNKDTREKYLCPVCGKELLNKYYLSAHIKHQHDNTAQSKYTCTVCNQKFISSGGYRLHMMVHRGEKPHTCDECGKAFTSKGGLRQHMMTHTDERPYTCSCGKGFRSSTGLGKHTRRTKHDKLD